MLARTIRDWVVTVILLAGLFGLIALAIVVRTLYESVMLPVRIYRAERDAWRLGRACDESLRCHAFGMDAHISWPEHLVREDREFATGGLVTTPRAHRLNLRSTPYPHIARPAEILAATPPATAEVRRMVTAANERVIADLTAYTVRAGSVSNVEHHRV